ncbi:MAG: hypothetical protein ABI273_22655 [Lacunisphaera sp.]
MAIIDDLKPIGLLYNEGRYDDCMRDLRLLWNNIPPPKEQDGNTFLVLLYATKILLLQGKKEEAIEWALKGMMYNGTRSLGGEGELLLGACAFEAGRMELARDMFCTARRKGGKRIFKLEKKEYLELTEKKNG